MVTSPRVHLDSVLGGRARQGALEMGTTLPAQGPLTRSWYVAFGFTRPALNRGRRSLEVIDVHREQMTTGKIKMHQGAFSHRARNCPHGRAFGWRALVFGGFAIGLAFLHGGTSLLANSLSSGSRQQQFYGGCSHNSPAHEGATSGKPVRSGGRVWPWRKILTLCVEVNRA